MYVYWIGYIRKVGNIVLGKLWALIVFNIYDWDKVYGVTAHGV
jgi:hypothetical protein